MVFLCRRKPTGASLEELLDFCFKKNHSLLGPSQVREEITNVLKLLRGQSPRTMVEIGTANGGTLFMLCRLTDPKGTIISIDLPHGIHGGGYPAWKTLLYRRFARGCQTINLIRADSRDPKTIEQLRGILSGGKIDCLFIDGDHTYNGVKADFENYLPFVAKGGMVVFHDICKHASVLDCKVDLFWAEVREKYPHQEFIQNPDQGWAGIGVLFID
jgi:predicted O-methyltransferase YrrM